jgi:hypothetical protein
MPAVTVSLAAADLGKRMQERLRGLTTAASPLLWQQGANKVLVHVDSLVPRFLNGWLVCNLDLQADATGRQTLQFVFFLGDDTAGNGLAAGASINAASAPAAQLAEVWGASVQRVLWDAVLDALEAFLAQTATRFPGLPVALGGFQASPNGLSAVVLAGDK